MINPLPNGFVQFIDSKGNPLNNGTVQYFHPGTSTPKTTWQNGGQTIANPNPIQLDAFGRAIVFGAGRFRQQVRTASGSIVFDGETSAGQGNLPLATGLSSIFVDEDVETLTTAGFSEAGKGAACYRRLSTAPSLNEQQAGLGRWLFRTNGNALWWRLAEIEPTDLMFGVLATATVTVSAGTMTIGGADDTAALQAAIDYVLYFGEGCGKRLRMPAGMRRITSTVHLGYGDRYIDWQIDGDFTTGFSEPANYRAGLFADFNDRPLFNIQGARMARISGIAIYGLNHAWLAGQVPQMTDRTALTSWQGPQMQSSAVNTRYAPYTGICVDGYSGVRQAESGYPDVAYPAWLGAQGQYSKGSSSNVEFKDMTCAGFEVGFAVQPNAMPSASNGDFMHFTSCDFGQNLVGVSISHADARVICFDRAKFHFCHTAFDSLTYGGGVGNIAASFANCSFDGVYRALNVDLGISVQPFAPAVVFTNIYGEGMYTLGTVRSNQATGRPGAIRFIGGELGFFNRSGEFAPVSYLDGRGQVAAYFQDVSIIGTHGLFPVDCDLREFTAILPAVSYQVFEQTTLSGRRAATALSGVHAPLTGTVSVRPYTFYGYDGAARFDLRINSHGWDFTGSGALPSGAHIPLATRSIAYGGQSVAIAQAPVEVLDRGQFPLSNVSNAGNEWTFSVAAAFLSDIDAPSCCLGQGDIVRDATTGVLFYVKSVVFSGSGAQMTADLTLRQITRVRTDNGTAWSTDAVLAAATGTLEFTCARRIVAGARRRMAMATTEGSGSISLVAMGAETFTGSDLGPVVRTVAPGDFVLPSWRGAATTEDSVFAKGRVVTVASTAGVPTGQITLDAPARRSGYWPAPVFIKGS